ncbi:MAG: urease accessory UreF family protein [Pseudoruegeria sp.]
MTGDLLKLNQWLSPAFPVGGFAYSHGLEQAIDAGGIQSADDLFVWLSDVLRHGSGLSDAVFLCVTHSGGDVLNEYRAMAPSKERLEEAEAQGAAFAQTVSHLLRDPVADGPLPIAIGHAARHLSLSTSQVTAFYLHSFVSNLISAAVRFVPLGQTDGQLVLARLHPIILQIASTAQTMGIDQIGTAALGSDMAAMKHETMEVRLFRS